ncbi:MAG: sulfite exporter TauE/SafE family protein, partial [Planctomycetaceae bacterium]|nr:sulfite exporter TauE/SafE family protein [Planctomycetaceae bacterium]
VIYFMRHRERMPRVEHAGAAATVLVGAGLGFFSSFLGIGGGPFNVIAIMIVLSVDAKPAAAYSLVVILFSQMASLGLSLVRGGYADCDLSMLPYMAVAAVAGGFVGAKLQKSYSNERVARLFNAVQFLVLALCIVNALRSLHAA